MAVSTAVAAVVTIAFLVVFFRTFGTDLDRDGWLAAFLAALLVATSSGGLAFLGTSSAGNRRRLILGVAGLALLPVIVGVAFLIWVLTFVSLE